MDCGDGSAVRSMYSSSGGPEFDSRNLHQAAYNHLPVTPAPGVFDTYEGTFTNVNTSTANTYLYFKNNN